MRAHVDEFNGLAKDVHRAKLPTSQFQTDEGGDRFERGTWKVRRGMVRSNFDQAGGGGGFSSGFSSGFATLLSTTDREVRNLSGMEVPDDHVVVIGTPEITSGNDTPADGTGEDANTSLSSSFPSEPLRPFYAEFRRNIYMSDGWRRMKRWDGSATALVDVGIKGPNTAVGSWTPSPTTAAGDTTTGVHKFRYRYLDSTTGYVSNPSEEVEITVAAGAEELTFPIDASGLSNMIRSTDSKVDKIVIEMTVAGGAAFFKAAEGLQSAADLVVDIDDVALATQFLPWADEGHDQPPVRRYVVSHRGYLFAFGSVIYSRGIADVTNGSATVDGSDTDWTEEAIGSSTNPAVIPLLFQVDGDTTAYSFAADGWSADNKFDLSDNYGGTTAVGVGYKIFSRSNVIHVSRADFPESFPPLNFIPGPEGTLSGEVRAGIGYASGMLFYSLHSVDRLVWDADPITGTRISVGNRGALHQRVAILVESRAYSLDREGFWFYEGQAPVSIDSPVKEILYDEINWDAADAFHAVWYERLRVVRWYVCTGTDTLPKDYLEWNHDRGVWARGSRDQEITASARVPTSEGPRVLLGDAHGYTWFDDKGTADGVDGSTNSHYTVATGSTTSTIELTGDALPITGTGAEGVYAYWLEGDEGSLVSSNAANQITLLNAFTQAPTTGDTVWLGRVPAKLKTKAFVGMRGPRDRQKPRMLHLFFEPLSNMRLLLVRVYENYSATAKTWGRDRDVPRGHAAWPAAAGGYAASDFRLDLSTSEGSLRVGLGSANVRTVEIELEVIEPDTALELFGLELDGFEGEPPE